MSSVITSNRGFSLLNVAQCFARLSSILAKRTMAPAKLDEIKIKANILASFAAEKAGEVAQEVKEEAEGVAKKAEHLVGKASEDL